ncbi:MAG: DUF6291 domain-containing protein [Spirochaetales bacterium]|nr:DUF6291 domain-containing protein [Spirochaetales bacterium]
MAERKNFIVRGEHRDAIALLSKEQKGELLDAMFIYNLDEKEPELDGMVKMAFAFLKNSFDYDREKHKKTCERNRRNGKKGGRPKTDEPTENEENPKNPGGSDDNPQYPNGSGNNPENPVGSLGTDSNREEPKKANTNTKSNTKSNIPPYIPPSGESVGCVRDFSKEWDRLRIFWNSSGLPEYKKLFVNLSDAGEVKNWMNAYTEDEIQAAITNYRTLLPRIPPTEKTYDTFYGFIRSGIDRFHDGVNPSARYESEEEKKVHACAPEPAREISEEEREEVNQMMKEAGGILGMIAKSREAAHA